MVTNFKWWRKWQGGVWYKHEFTHDAMQISLPPCSSFWARYGKINRYTDVIETEDYTITNKKQISMALLTENEHAELWWINKQKQKRLIKK